MVSRKQQRVIHVIHNKTVGMQSMWVSTMKTFQNLVTRSGNVRKREPRIFRIRSRGEMNKIFVTVTDFTRIKNFIKRKRRWGRIRMKRKRKRIGVGVKLRRIIIGFEKRNMKDGIKIRKVGWEVKLVGKRGDTTKNGKGTEMTVVKLVRRTNGFDITSEEPDKLIRLVCQLFDDMEVEVFELNGLGMGKFCTKLSMNVVEMSCEILSSRDGGLLSELRGEGGVTGEIGKERGLCKRPSRWTSW